MGEHNQAGEKKSFGMDEKDFQINQKNEMSKKKHAALKCKSSNRRVCPAAEGGVHAVMSSQLSTSGRAKAPNHTDEEREEGVSDL